MKTAHEQEYQHLIHELRTNEKLARDAIPECHINPSNPVKIQKANANLLYPMTEHEVQSILDGDGHELDWKLAQVNSSAALLMNTLHAIKPNTDLTIQGIGSFQSVTYEKKLKVLETSSKCSNLDGLLSNEDTFVFIESKFTELFYPQKSRSTISKKYREMNEYPDKDIFEAIEPFLRWKCKAFDLFQIIRHTIAIYRDVFHQQSLYQDKKVVLLNLAWELKNINQTYPTLYEIQVEALAELNSFGLWFNKAIQPVFSRHQVAFEFIYISYEDFITKLTNISQIDPLSYNYLTMRYLFHKNDDLSHEDIIQYLSACLLHTNQKEDFLHEIQNHDVLSIDFKQSIIIPHSNDLEESVSKIIQFKYMIKIEDIQSHPNFEGILIRYNLFTHYQIETILNLGKK